MLWLAAVIVILAAFFASSHPDGLDFVSEKLGFAGKGQESPAPMPDYKLGCLPKERISTAIAGIVGILIILGIFAMAVYISKRYGNKINMIAGFLMLILILASPVFAARPLVTDDYYTIAQGGYELEIGYASTQNQASQANSANLSFKRGVLDRFDLGIEIPYTLSSPAGLNDVLLHAKYRLWERGEDEGLTGRIDYKFNNGNAGQGLGSGDNDYSLLLIYSRKFGKTKAHLNFGHVTVGINAGVQTDDYFAYAIAMEYPVWGDKGDIMAEYVGNNADSPGPAFFQIGARFLVASGLKMDAGYSLGMNDRSLKSNLTAGMHYEF